MPQIADKHRAALGTAFTQTTFTQTYSTALATVPAAFTDTVVDANASAGASTWGFSSAAKANALIADLLATKKALNSVIDLLQDAGYAL